MNISPRFGRLVVGLFFFVCVLAQAAPPMTAKDVPDPLKPWQGWVLWGDDEKGCPSPYSDGKTKICFWPTRLALQVDGAGGRFDFAVTAYAETWVVLPGSNSAWPLEVKVDGAVAPVVAHEEEPSVRVGVGTHVIAGAFRWAEMPQSLTVPDSIGMLVLTLNGQAVPLPSRDEAGELWLKREATLSEETAKDFLDVKVYAKIEDGIPLWLETEVEMAVSGKSREEQIGEVLPAGWQLASVESEIPVAVDEKGQMKAQVRAGKWTARLRAFRIDNPKEFAYAGKAAVEDELVAFQAKPDFRMVDIVGSPSIDVSQTPFPDDWKELPVYRWETATPFKIEERMRGMGSQKPEGIKITRELWLDENGKALTFQDRLRGNQQQIWRLDVAAGQELGSVRSGDEGQLITRNPQTGAPGVEVRTRNIDLLATGRMERGGSLSASGWQADADGVNVQLNLPPGWRLFALFGADWVTGDWLTSWTLLDLFLLLIFSLAVFRLWGFVPAVIAFLAFGLAYHEPNAPRLIWLVLLVPLALLRVVPAGWGRKLLLVWKWATIAVLILLLAPFLAGQVQQALYPQLEEVYEGPSIGALADAETNNREVRAPAPMASSAGARLRDASSSTSYGYEAVVVEEAADKSNLAYDAKARIQTGPGVPNWTWRRVGYGWNGPVAVAQQVHPVLISVTLERVISVARVALLLALAAVLLNVRSAGGWVFRKGGVVAMVAVFFFGAMASAQAQFPNQQMLDQLRERMLEKPDVYPTAADVPAVSVSLRDRKIMMDAEIHTVIECAVPLPGRLPAWSPISVVVDGKAAAALRRDDDYLWIVLPAGVHRVHVEGLIGDANEWEWAFLLKPHRVTIDAPGWTFSGVKPSGEPESQVFFVLQEKTGAAAASYERQDVQPLVEVTRDIELGLVWQADTTVKRLTPVGRAVSLRIPLLPGENVMTSNVMVRDGFVEVRLGSHEEEFTWHSELSVSPTLKLATQSSDTWVEHWGLVVSPVWNVGIAGLAPIFDAANTELIPEWRPWPGEGVELAVSRPEAIPGATMTVEQGTYGLSLGARQRTGTLNLALRCSLGEDFLIDLPDAAEVTSLTVNTQTIPVRKDGTKLIVPLRPGEQKVFVNWRINEPMGVHATADQVKLPVDSANITTNIVVPESRWVLWTHGPLRGPAVQFWTVLVCALLAALVLGRIGISPLGAPAWMLLALGLTQVPLPAALLVVAWLFFLAWRGRDSYLRLPVPGYNLLQVFLIGLTVVAMGIFVAVVAAGLLGDPRMFIRGNDSTSTMLSWYQARSGEVLPEPGLFSISIWWYRLLMLVWALWLAASLIRWLRWAWEQFSKGGCFRRAVPTPPPIPPVDPAKS